MTEAERIEVEVRAFLVDRRHLDYIQTDRNRDLIVTWLEQEGLAISMESLHMAYVALHDQLDVHKPVSQPVTAQPPQPTIAQAPQAPVPQAGAAEQARLHTVERRPGESSWMAARRAFAEQQIAEQRKARQEMRAKMQSLPPRKSQSREINNLYAAARKPRGKGAALIVDRPDWKME